MKDDIRQKIIDAAIHYDCNAMRQLLAAGADFNVVDPNEGTTAFAEAIYWGITRDCVVDMLRLGANPDVAPTIGGTPLIYAVWQLDFVLIQMLLDAGANPNTPGYTEGDPMTPLDAACYEYHCKVTEAEHKLIGAMEFLLKSRGAKRYHQLKETV